MPAKKGAPLAHERADARAATRIGARADAASDINNLFTSISCAVFAAGRYTFPPNWRLTPRNVPYYRLFVATDGRASFAVSGASHTLDSGGVILIPPHTTRQARHDPAAAAP